MSIAFDASYYLLAYPDVAAAVVRGQFPNAYTHFVLHGAKELRNPNAQFNAAEYAGMYPDVANAVAAGRITNVWDHYVTFGISENRAPSLALKDFDAASYLAIHTDVAAAVTAGAFKSAIDHYLLNGQAEGRTWGENISLTNGTDKLVANKFVAGLVYTPGGNDRINSLQDEDELTGIGVNPTLTATLGNANDNGSTVITPILKGIETVNVAFTGSNGTGAGATAVTTLDLQDSTGLSKAVNITRITDELASVNIRNMTSVPAELSLSNTHSPATAVNFTFLASATAGTADATQVNLSNANVGSLKVEAHNGSNGVETITLNSRGAPNSIGTFTAQDLQTLNITGDQALTITSNTVVRNGTLTEAVAFTGGLANVAGSLSKIDGSTATGNLTLNLGGIFTATKDGTSGTDIAVEVLGGKGNDTFIITDTLGANDKIDGGEGANTIIMSGGNIAGTAAKVQTLDIRTDAATVTVDTSKLADLATVIVRNEGNDNVVPVAAPAATPTVVTLNKLSASVAENAGIVVKHGTTGNNNVTSLEVVANLATATGANDKVVFTIAEGVNADPRFNVTLTAGGTTDATRVESITINDSDSEANTVKLTNNLQHTGTITLKGGIAGVFLNLDSEENVYGKQKTGGATDSQFIENTPGTNTGALVASVIDAETFVGDAILRVSSSPLALSAVGAQTVKLGSGNDTLIFDNLSDSTAGLTISDTVSGGAGNDTLAIGGDQAVLLRATEWTNVTGFETIRLLGNNGFGYTLELSDALITRNAADGKVINIVNDNNPLNDAAENLEVGGGAVSAVVIDARALSAGLSFNYNGEEGATTDDRFIFADHNINSTAVIDGGAADNKAGTWGGNGDTLEVRNSAVVSTGDLQNIKNVTNIELTNDTATHQNFTVQLNDAIVDAMVDSYHTSTTAQSETLYVTAIDNTVLPAAHSILRLEAGDLTAKSNIQVAGGSGADTLILGAGADVIFGGKGADYIVTGLGADTVVYTAAGTDAWVGSNATLGGNTSATIIANTSITVAAVGGTFGANAGVVANQTGMVEVIADIAVGDKINLGNADIGAWSQNLNTGLGVATDDQASVISGTYNAATGLFTSAANGADSVIIWDADAANGATAFNAIVLVGVTSAEAAAATFAGGVVTF